VERKILMDRIKSEIIKEAINEFVNSDFYYDFLDNLTGTFLNELGELEISVDEIFQVVDSYLNGAWPSR
jgi:hypothetical protein